MSKLTDAETALEQLVQGNTEAIATLSTRVGKLEAAPPGAPSSPAQITNDQVVAAIRTMLLGTTAMPGGGQPSGGPAVDYFPEDPGAAPFPSPEKSTSTVLNGHLSGAPYVRSAQGAIFQFHTDANGAPIPVNDMYGQGYQMAVNGEAVPNLSVEMITVRQGQVYFQADSIWSTFELTDASASGVAHTTLPPPWTATGTDAAGQTAQLPDMPAAPEAFTAWTGNVVLFGDAQPHKDMQSAHDAANPGDTIQAGPEMVGRSVVMCLGTTKPLVVDLLGRVTANAGGPDAVYTPGMLLDISALDYPQLPHQLGAIVPTQDCIVRGVDCTGAGMKSQEHDGTAAIRAGAPINLWVDHCHLHKNQNGIGPSDFPGTLKETNSVMVDNYLPVDPKGAGSHNVYAEGVAATFGPGVTSIVNQTGSLAGGHSAKSRAKITTFVEPGYFYSGDSSSIDIPDGSTAVCHVGAITIAKKAGDENHVVVGYGVESQRNGLAGMSFAGTVIDAECENPLMGATGPMTFDAAVVFKGTRPTAPQGAPVKGL